MSYFRKLDDKIEALLKLCAKNEHWLVLINADPDALASALALKRILARRVAEVAIGQINVITRPDNLAMIKYLHIPTQQVDAQAAAQNYDRLAIVDSQPNHNPAFEGLNFSVVIDHHPIKPEAPVQAPFSELKPEYGSNSTILTEYLYNLKIRPGKNLATALLYGIKSDTQDFERDFCDADVKAFRYLNKFADRAILRKIVRSEFHLAWLKHFNHAFKNLVLLKPGCIYVPMGQVKNPDILVILADFFLRVHEVTWTIVSGISDDKAVLIFRSDGITKDVGKLAKSLFDDIGSAGGHKSAARAEIPLSVLDGKPPYEFLLKRLDPKKKRVKLPKKWVERL